ncbi:transmembrane protein, putative (macronuclear) [Tetrahymena thermophila SB210]|uniref:Transmembrane protein, putative n=1 Tax=Tetrahymena thermophila (strain SB210) TaxID=312017 RepID=W7XBZ6_TETTS|nr:transmembrane protein, putative [Tetrahymena thermophila SB210]EWS74857.1 transmembrane protein, putative [Tetrahymena thermophila SB210]|eukprot:XP_012652570.1 transmembrane protein, putative [Tetrahymena thermophila SB210]
MTLASKYSIKNFQKLQMSNYYYIYRHQNNIHNCKIVKTKPFYAFIAAPYIPTFLTVRFRTLKTYFSSITIILHCVITSILISRSIALKTT